MVGISLRQLLICAVIVASVVLARDRYDPPSGKKVLAILEDMNIKGTHGMYFKFLQENGYSITFQSAEEPVTFQSYGEWKFDFLIVFAPTADDLSGIETNQILAFIDDGHSVILATNSKIGDAIREVASDCNVEFDEKDTEVIDHFHFDSSDQGTHSLLALNNVPKADIIFGKDAMGPILFRGVAQDFDSDSPLLFSLLNGYSTTYSANPRKDINKEPHVLGKKTSLVTALQARNNARVVFSGSLELFSDKLFRSQVKQNEKMVRSGNRVFCEQTTLWAFLERGLLRYRNIDHHRVGEKIAPASYTIKEDVEYSVTLEEWNGRRWMPFVSNDVQLEFSMLDPYVRTGLKGNSKGVYNTQFKLPDVYGIFTFKVEYTRKGYGFLSAIIRTPVRPFRHNEYERFIESAYPYYASSFSMMGGLFVFTWFFLYHRVSA